MIFRWIWQYKAWNKQTVRMTERQRKLSPASFIRSRFDDCRHVHISLVCYQEYYKNWNEKEMKNNITIPYAE